MEPMSLLQPTPLQEPVADLGCLNGWGGGGANAKGTRVEAPQAPRGMGRGRGSHNPEILF